MINRKLSIFPQISKTLGVELAALAKLWEPSSTRAMKKTVLLWLHFAMP